MQIQQWTRVITLITLSNCSYYDSMYLLLLVTLNCKFNSGQQGYKAAVQTKHTIHQWLKFLRKP